MPTTEQDLYFRIGELERKLAYLCQHLNVDVPPVADGLPVDVQQAIMAGDKIGAIQLLRRQTGMDLAQAKAAVEGGASDLPRIIE